MFNLRTVALCAVLIAVGSGPVAAQKKDGDKETPKISEKDFYRVFFSLLLDPTNDKAEDAAKIVMAFTTRTPKSAVLIGKDELEWCGMTKDAAARKDRRPLLLMAAYTGGNTQAQIATGVRRNDRYAGLLAVFEVYRKLRAKDKDFKVAALDSLLALHKAGKLSGHLAELDKKDNKVEN